MKTFRLIGMALLALCVTFASCSSDDEETTKNEEWHCYQPKATC